LLRTLLRLRHDLVMIGRAAAAPLPETLQTRLGPPLARVAENLEVYLRGSGDALIARRAPPPLAAADAALDDHAAALAGIRGEGLTLGLPVETVERIFTVAFALEQIHQHLRDLERCVRDVARRR
jgi:AcrR family transcriptional regulator